MHGTKMQKGSEIMQDIQNIKNLVESLERRLGRYRWEEQQWRFSRAKIMSIWDSGVDQHHLDAEPDADPDSTYHPNADTDADFILMRIRMRIRIRLRTQILASSEGSNRWKSAKIGSYLINFGSSFSNWRIRIHNTDLRNIA